jgi:transcriptional repressor NrdR
MTCPSCGAATHILETRSAEAGAAIRRRRECKQCGRRFTSFERREREPGWVLKRGGARQRFNADKLRGALARATHKREEHVSPADLDAIVSRIEVEIEASGGELSSERVRELCLEGLSEVDAGAYLQFAGVELSDLDSVRAELTRLDARKDRDFSPLASVSSVRGEEEAKRPTTGERTRGAKR